MLKPVVGAGAGLATFCWFCGRTISHHLVGVDTGAVALFVVDVAVSTGVGVGVGLSGGARFGCRFGFGSGFGFGIGTGTDLG
jgi:hypothetical protein